MAANGRGNEAPRSLLERLPFEEQMDRLLDRLSGAVRGSRLARRLQEWHDSLPTLPPRTIPTPLGRLTLEAINPLPEFIPPTLDARQKEAVKAAVAMDIAGLLGIVPVVGDYVAEELEDLFTARLRGLLTPEEHALFEKFDKVNPLDTLAMMRAIVHAQKNGRR